MQGPASLATLQRLAANAKTARRLAAIRRTDLWETELAGIAVVVARTGYTGEDFGYELFVHPDRATAFWEAILAAGADLGVKPCGLGARDSTRTEAGLPLHGHELAGPRAISPAAAGFAPYVKLHKPFFVGRSAFVAEEKSRTMEVLRFRIAEKGGRMAKTGDVVANARGIVVGHVTSCAMDVDGFQIGMAYADRRAHVVGETLVVFPSPGAAAAVAVGQRLEPGSKVVLPAHATILSRFRRSR